MNRWLNRLLHFCTHLPSSSDHSPAPAHRRPTVEAYQGRDSAVTDRTIPPANLPQEHRCQHGDCVTCLYQKAHHTPPPPSLFIKDIWVTPGRRDDTLSRAPPAQWRIVHNRVRRGFSRCCFSSWGHRIVVTCQSLNLYTLPPSYLKYKSGPFQRWWLKIYVLWLIKSYYMSSNSLGCWTPFSILTG